MYMHVLYCVTVLPVCMSYASKLEQAAFNATFMQILATYLAAAAAVLFGVAVHPPRKYESNYTDTRCE